MIKVNNGKMFRYHGAIANIFIKGRRDWFNICIANKTIKGKKSSISCQKPTGQFLVPLQVKYFLLMYLIQFSKK